MEKEKLKTLKEIYPGGDWFDGKLGIGHQEKLKAEAVKWVKMFKKKMCYRESALLIMFFNLTEDDLK